MDPMTDIPAMNNPVTEFYDSLSADYDLMTGFEKRFIQERPFFRMFVDKYQIASALDAGCGTGFHSLLLAQMGVAVTAVDISQKMLEKVNEHARELSLSVTTLRADFQELSAAMGAQVDAVFSLGNSLAHLHTSGELLAALRNFNAVLKPNGMLFLQTLNYDRIMEAKEKIQNTKEIGSKTFVRSYDYTNDGIVFHIKATDRSSAVEREKDISVPLRPLKSKELVDVLAKAGFADVRLYGGVSLQEFHPEESKDLVVLARKPE